VKSGLELVRLSHLKVPVGSVAIPSMRSVAMKSGGTTSYGFAVAVVIKLGSLSM
jgi:hypothetical protein